MKIKTITKTFIFPLTMMILVFASCKKDDNKDKEKLALGLILLSQSGQGLSEQDVITSAAVAQTAVAAARIAAQGGGSVFNKAYTKDFLLAYAKDKLNAKFPYLKLTAITATDGTCTYDSSTSSYTCSATLNGTAGCRLGGSVTFTNVQVNMTGVYAGGTGVTGSFNLNFSSTINGNISYTNCKTFVDTDYDFIGDEVTMNGSSNVNINDTFNGTFNGTNTASGLSMNYNYTTTENGTVNVRDFSINGQSIGNQDYQVDINIRVIGSQTLVNMNNLPPISSTTYTIDNTLNGYVRINSQTVKEFNNTNIRRTCTSSFNTDTGEFSYNCN